MKTNFGITVILLCSLALFTRCDKLSSLYKLTATIGGSTFQCPLPVTTQGAFTIPIPGSSFSGNGFTIAATSTSAVLTIYINGDSAKTYNCSTTAPIKTGCGCAYNPSLTSTSNIYYSTNGTVTLTNVNTSAKQITGTFSFNVVNSATNTTLAITSGTFTNIGYN